jgi:hypothetical protein
MSFLMDAMTRVLKGLGWGLILVTFSSAAQQQPQAHRPRQFMPGSLKRVEEIPASRLRSRLDNLPATARDRALQRLRNFHFTELDLDTLYADSEGGVYYVDSFPPPPPATAEEIAAASAPATADAALPVSPFPQSLVFHSKPGSVNVIYLNFSGSTVINTAWNTSLGKTSIPAVAFSTDSDFSTFSDSEQAAIKQIWLRVAEDYAPFDVDVTTERPATMDSRTAEALITRNTDNDGSANPSSTAGGVAYVGVFGSTGFYRYRPAWIYYNNLANNESYIAEAAAHEIGHNLGLSHDGKTDGTAYYGGHGGGDTSWGPIMGTGYYRNVSEWSKGDYYLANNTQDDLATIASYIPCRLDDHGNTMVDATPLTISGGTNVVSTRPDTDPGDLDNANKGILEQNIDVDAFSFVTGTGPVLLSVNPWLQPSGTRGGNLDILLELYNSSGTLVLTNNPAAQTQGQIQTNLTAGTYYLYVRNTGTGNPFAASPDGYTAYGSIGQYFINGYTSPALPAPLPPQNLRIVAN